MVSPIHKAWKLIDEFEKRFGIDLGILEVRFHHHDHLAYYHPKKKMITLPARARGRKLKEFLYHELAHAILFTYTIPKELLSLFYFVCPMMEERYALRMMDREEPAPETWVSWYAMTNPVEDFCETLSAWASNDYRITRSWQFGGFRFSPLTDLTLRKKIEEVRNLLKFLELR